MEKGARKCQRSFGDFQRGVLVKTDAEFLTTFPTIKPAKIIF
jgi:hypothetical protein